MRGRGQRIADDRLGLFQYPAQMGLAAKTLGVDFVDVLGAGRTRGEPAIFRDRLQPAKGRIVARSPGENGLDFFARQLGKLNLLW